MIVVNVVVAEASTAETLEARTCMWVLVSMKVGGNGRGGRSGFTRYSGGFGGRWVFTSLAIKFCHRRMG